MQIARNSPNRFTTCKSSSIFFSRQANELVVVVVMFVLVLVVIVRVVIVVLVLIPVFDAVLAAEVVIVELGLTKRLAPWRSVQQ